MLWPCTDGKTAEFAVFNEFNHIIDKRINSEFQPSELQSVVNKDKIGIMSISKAGVYINDIMELSIMYPKCFLPPCFLQLQK